MEITGGAAKLSGARSSAFEMGDAMINLTEQRVSRGLVVLVCIAWLSVIAPGDAQGQQPSAADQAAAEFDLSRARLAERSGPSRRRVRP